MKWRMYGNEFQLATHIIRYTESTPVFDVNAETPETMEMEELAFSAEELARIESQLTERGITYTVTEQDNTGHEWLQGKVFTNQQYLDGLVDKAVELGEVGYYTLLTENDENAQRDLLIVNMIMEIETLKAGELNG